MGSFPKRPIPPVAPPHSLPLPDFGPSCSVCSTGCRRGSGDARPSVTSTRCPSVRRHAYSGVRRARQEPDLPGAGCHAQPIDEQRVDKGADVIEKQLRTACVPRQVARGPRRAPTTRRPAGRVRSASRPTTGSRVPTSSDPGNISGRHQTCEPARRARLPADGRCRVHHPHGRPVAQGHDGPRPPHARRRERPGTWDTKLRLVHEHPGEDGARIRTHQMVPDVNGPSPRPLSVVRLGADGMVTEVAEFNGTRFCEQQLVALAGDARLRFPLHR
jgi:hypothetical protein